MDNLDLVLLARVVLGVTFLLSGLIHLADRRGFLLSVLEYRVLPSSLARIYAFWTPWAEAVAGLLVVVGMFSLLAAVVLLVLLTSYAVAVVVNLVRGRRFECGCFGGLIEEHVGFSTLARIAVLAALAVFVARSALGGSWMPAIGQGHRLPTVLVGVFTILLGYLIGNVALFRAVLLPSNRQHSEQRSQRMSLDPGSVRVEDAQ